MLINKMIQRQKEIDDQKNKMIEILGSEKGSMKDEKDLLAGVNELSKLNAQEFGKMVEQKEHKKEKEQGDLFQVGKELKVERQRQRAE